MFRVQDEITGRIHPFEPRQACVEGSNPSLDTSLMQHPASINRATNRLGLLRYVARGVIACSLAVAGIAHAAAPASDPLDRAEILVDSYFGDSRQLRDAAVIVEKSLAQAPSARACTTPRSRLSSLWCSDGQQSVKWSPTPSLPVCSGRSSGQIPKLERGEQPFGSSYLAR